MGVHGLMKFVCDNRKQLLKPFALKDTQLIIDGNGIYHILYKSLEHKSDYFGGNYDAFAKLCEDFFTELIECKIKPYVFFDGVQDEEKIEETLHRLKERTECAKQMSEGKKVIVDYRLLPVLSYETLKSVLRMKGIHIESCIGESDPQMAICAKKLNCPIMTCDSDFFLYDIPKGVIVVDHLDLKSVKTRGTFLEVEIYYISNFMLKIGLKEENHEMIALLAAVLGNDRMSSLQFSRFFDEDTLPKRCNELTDKTVRKRVLKTLGWLQSEQTVDNAISALIRYYKPIQQDQFKEAITRSIDEYTNPTLETVLRTSHIFETLPIWFVEDFRKCKIPVPALAAIIGRPVIFPPQVSALSEPSPYQCCLSARKIMYRLLFGPVARPRIAEYDKNERGQLRMWDVCLNTLIDTSKSIQCLNDINGLSYDKRFLILLENLDLSAELIKQYPKDTQLLVVATIFWLQNIMLEIDGKRYLYTLLVCFFRNGKFDSCLNVTGAVTSRSRFAMLDRLFEVPIEISPTTFDCKVVHVFSQFQCCLQTVIYLSQILRLSPDPIHLVTGFNGTFLHNFYRKLSKSETDPELFMENLFGKDVELIQMFYEVRNGIEEIATNVDSWETVKCRRNKAGCVS